MWHRSRRQSAYQTGKSPATTEGAHALLCSLVSHRLTRDTLADIATLKRMLGHLTESMRQSGVGALPVLHGGATVPNEAQLFKITTDNVRAVYTKLQSARDSSAVVANLLAMDHAPVRVASQALQK